MPLPREVSVPAEDGLVFQAKIDGKGPFKALFDTGAGVNILSAGVARKLGLKLDQQPTELGTSSPATVQVHKTHVDTLEFDDVLLRDQTFYVVDLPEGNGAPSFVMGYELLRRFVVRIDFDRQRLTFYDGAQFHYSGPGAEVPLRIQDNALLVRTSIGDASGWFELDTGNESGTMMFTNFAVKNNMVQALGAHDLAYNGRGFAGPSPQAYLVRLNTMRIGDVRVPGIVAHVSTDPSDKRDLDGNIGQDVLRHFAEIFDCVHGKVYFETTKESAQPEVFNRAGLVFDSFGHGLQVMTVLPGSPGADAGIHIGDVITAIDGKSPGDELNQPAFLEPPGTHLKLTVQRGTVTREATVVLRDVL
jgi:hypothetical protein